MLGVLAWFLSLTSISRLLRKPPSVFLATKVHEVGILVIEALIFCYIIKISLVLVAIPMVLILRVLAILIWQFLMNHADLSLFSLVAISIKIV